MTKRKLLISIGAGIMALIMILSVVIGVLPYMASAATSSSALKKQLDKLKQEQKEIKADIKEIQSQVDENKDKMTVLVDKKNAIDQEIFKLYQEISNINEQIATYNTLISDKNAELEDAKARLAELNKKNKERIRAMEEDGELSYWSVLFKANDFADFLDRVNMVNEIAAADKRRLDEISAVAEEISKVMAELETEKAALEVTKKELDDTQAELEKKREAADALLAELVATGEEYQKLLDEAEDKAAEIGKDIKDTKNKYDNAKRQEWLATSVPPTKKPSGGGGGSAGTGQVVAGIKWLVPCNYTRFSSPYGMRLHPVYKVYKMHYGVDLGAKQGTPIIATRAGTIKWATWDNSAGFYVGIDHGDGFQSIYMHMTHYIVSKGQKVNAGQVIGYVGSTGTSTGPHLHFGIKYNGNYVNPANYINI
ncbi:MAG: peptidoglycan DD-metalloendopeptidase family protein [Oscillospiraceae bacterium]|nr:peptidoglycan DD-metalloendopeptidase family protein [Oscillospiraceae bacterium]